jgi:nucleotide-binding universal stress UspA family protein
MKLIIAATDFSNVSLNAVEYAASMAIATNSNLALFHVCEVPLPLSEVPISSIDMQSLIDDANATISRLKLKLNESYKGLHISTEVRLSSSIFEQLRDYCTVNSPFAVVIGSNATGALERFMLGNTAVSLAQDLEWPLIVVPPTATFTSIRNVGLASDFEDVQHSTPLAELINVITAFNARLHVVHVKESGKPDREKDHQEFTNLREMLKNLHPSYHIVSNAHIDKEIHNFAERNKLDMLIVIPRRHGMLGKLLHKSHTRQIVLHAHIPTMAIHE